MEPTAESPLVESELLEEVLLAAVNGEGVTILLRPDNISVQISVSSEEFMLLVDPVCEEPRLALVEAVVVEELELVPLVPEEVPPPLLEARLLLPLRLEIT